MKKLFIALVAVVGLLKSNAQQIGPDKGEKWNAIHLLDYTNNEKLALLEAELPALVKKGINVIFLEVDYSFQFKSHPELIEKENYITKKAARKLKRACSKNDIRLIIQFQSLGHQSWSKKTMPLLTVYPELDLTPGAFPDNKDIYCREWDPMNPRVNQIVFALIDEIVSAFDVDGIHLGMDEIFLIDKPEAKSTNKLPPGEVFAKVINDFHDYFTKKKGIELFIWGDRLIDGSKIKHGAWEASLNGTHTAIDLIPKDVIICDWHYEPLNKYPSIPMFIEKGFKVLPASWVNIEGLEKLIKYSFSVDHPNMLGHLYTTWTYRHPISKYPSLIKGKKILDSKKFYDVLFSSEVVNNTSIKVKLETTKPNYNIYYSFTNNFSDSIHYQKPILIDKKTTVYARSYHNGVLMSGTTNSSFTPHKAMLNSITITKELSTKYNLANGKQALIDGVLGGNSYADGHWAAVEGSDMDFEISFDKPTHILSVQIRAFNNHNNNIFAPTSVSLFYTTATTSKGITKEVKFPKENQLSIINIPIDYDAVEKIRVHLNNRPSLIDKNEKTWIFIDEIIVK